MTTKTLEEVINESAVEQLEKLKLKPPVKSSQPMVKIMYNGTPLIIKGRTEWGEVRYAKLALRHAIYTHGIWDYSNNYAIRTLKHNQQKISVNELKQIEEDLVQTAYTMVKFEPV